MRLATDVDIPQLQQIYDQAIQYANKVGHIDWPQPFPASTLRDLISGNELYCFDDSQGIVAAVRLGTEGNSQIWKGLNSSGHLYLGKAAVASTLHSRNYFRDIMLPAIADSAHSGVVSIRLDCLSDNLRLRAYYERLGFLDRGTISFYSRLQSKYLTVTRYELPIPF